MQHALACLVSRSAHLSLHASIMKTSQEECLGTVVVRGGDSGCSAEQASCRQDLLHVSLRHRHLQGKFVQ